MAPAVTGGGARGARRVPRQTLVLAESAFAELAVQARKNRRMSTYALAEQAGVPHSAITRIEASEPVGQADLQAVCRILDLAFPAVTQNARVELAALLRDRRESAGLSRQQLSKKARLSDATIKFIETATHQPSRKTCLRLYSVAELGLAWADLAAFGGSPPSPAKEKETASSHRVEEQAPPQNSLPPTQPVEPAPNGTEARASLNCPASLPPKAIPTGLQPVVIITVAIYANGAIRIDLNPATPSPSA